MPQEKSIESRLEAAEDRITELENTLEQRINYAVHELVDHYNSEAVRAIRQVWDTARTEGDDAVVRIRKYLDERLDRITNDAALLAQDKTSAALVQQVVEKVKAVPVVKIQPPAYVAPKTTGTSALT